MFLIFLKSKNKRKHGFTLIEMMVAVSIFVIVAFIVTSTLITISYAYKKAQKMRLLMDNVNFSINSMTFALREGRDYVGCDGADGSGEQCSFIPIDRWLESGNSGARVCYVKGAHANSAKNTIYRCNDSCVVDSTKCEDTISPEVDITGLRFTKRQAGNGNSLITINIDGIAGERQAEKTTFSIQASSQQRNSL